MALINLGKNPTCRYPGCSDPDIETTIIEGCVFGNAKTYTLASSGRIHLHGAYLTNASVGEERSFWERLRGKNRLEKAPNYVKEDGVVIEGDPDGWFVRDEEVLGL